jgi:hypothetical protein
MRGSKFHMCLVGPCTGAVEIPLITQRAVALLPKSSNKPQTSSEGLGVGPIRKAKVEGRYLAMQGAVDMHKVFANTGEQVASSA